MPVLEALSEEECYLIAIIEDLSGLDLAEFCWHAPDHEDECFRAWAFQYSWWRCDDMYQIDQAGRAVGKSLGIKARGFAFGFNFPSQEMVITAPELIHLEPIVDLIETQIQDTRLSREMLKKGRAAVNHRPFMMRFQNGARIIGRIPQRDGRGAKGIHPIRLEQDEAQDYPKKGWTELNATLKRGFADAQWRCIAAGQLVLTGRGWVPIEHVSVGDDVLTHEQRWRPVLRVFDNGEQECIQMAGNGHHGLVVTADHKLYARSTLPRGSGRKRLGAPEWRRAGDFESLRRGPGVRTARHTHWASPTVVPTEDPIPPMVRLKRGRKSCVVQDTSDLTWLWLYGLYLAEGYGCSFMAHGRHHRRSHWCVNDGEADHVAAQLRAVGLNSYFYRQGPHSVKVIVSGGGCYEWLVENAGELAHNKRMARWAFGLPTVQRQAVFDGMTYGDGSWSEDRHRWEYGTASRTLAYDMKLFGQSLGYVSNVRDYKPAESVIEGRTVQKKQHFTIQMTKAESSLAPRSLFIDDLVWAPVEDGTSPVGRHHVFDLEVAEDHSYVVEGIIVSNCHGVTKGVQGDFYDKTKPDSEWTVHRITAMMRPNWTDEERQEELRKYGSAEDPDYRRNILGIHGDAMNTLFVLRKLMLVVDLDETSEYNSDQYFHRYIRDTDLEYPDDPERGGTELITRLNLPPVPAVYRTAGYQVWAGMDVGFTSDPSEILIWVEYHPSADELAVDRAMQRARPAKGLTRIRCIGRIGLRRIPGPLQTEVILHVFDHYEVAGLSMDKTGNGLPLFQGVQARLRAAASGDRARLQRAAERMKGYNFSEKILVDIEDVKADKTRATRAGTAKEATNTDLASEAGIERNVLEYSTDVLRDLVDAGRLMLPWDRETPTTSLIDEFHGQTFSFSNSPIDQYGRRRRIFAEGRFHAFDAARMAMLGMVQQHIEEFAAAKPAQEPVIDRPMGAW